MTGTPDGISLWAEKRYKAKLDNPKRQGLKTAPHDSRRTPAKAKKACFLSYLTQKKPQN